mmetsp:Transcript_41689/g.104056  ORF Transcript_41689/g.104056 Transcript_41689/m.104056 type:complete len:239 (-) Transcript_41689:442-1158(-)
MLPDLLLRRVVRMSLAKKGWYPPTNTKHSTPAPKQSTRELYECPCSTSGAIHPGVPEMKPPGLGSMAAGHTVRCRLSLRPLSIPRIVGDGEGLPRGDALGDGEGDAFGGVMMTAQPKSMSLTVSGREGCARTRFSALTSLWMTLCRWMKASDRRRPSTITRAVDSGTAPLVSTSDSTSPPLMCSNTNQVCDPSRRRSLSVAPSSRRTTCGGLGCCVCRYRSTRSSLRRALTSAGRLAP